MIVNAKTERWRIYFSDHAALELSMLSVASEAASEGMLFSAICAPSRFHTAKSQTGSRLIAKIFHSIAPSLPTIEVRQLNCRILILMGRQCDAYRKKGNECAPEAIPRL
jgi:hypothetical protein